MTYYSQGGEDYVIDCLLGRQSEGFFVEVGCIDGRRFSNTLSLEERGWRGMCIEAHADYIPLLRANRKRSQVVHCAVSDQDKSEVVFYANARGSFSTLDPTRESDFRANFAEWFSGFQPQRIAQRTLTSVFQEYSVPSIDVLSVDVEGHELPVLRGLDFISYRPRILVIECDDSDSVMDGLLLPLGCYKGPRVGCNRFYVTEAELLNRLDGREHTVALLHTQHPLDTGGDKTLERRVSTRYPSTARIEQDSSLDFFPVGFHGDEYLMALADALTLKAAAFVETGANVGSTLAYVGSRWPRLRCLSCEPDKRAFDRAAENTSRLSNVLLFNLASQEFLLCVLANLPQLRSAPILFWLDAHGRNFKWPLRDEIAAITRSFSDPLILVDDFKVPGKDWFGYDEYDGQICSLEYVKDSINGPMEVYYPCYTNRTSLHHPLRGWGLIVRPGRFVIPAILEDKMERVS